MNAETVGHPPYRPQHQPNTKGFIMAVKVYRASGTIAHDDGEAIRVDPLGHLLVGELVGMGAGSFETIAIYAPEQWTRAEAIKKVD